jgi:hypothetical protein
MIMRGNAMGDEGAKYIGDMLRVNKSLRILCRNPELETPVAPVGFSHLSNGLTHKYTLREWWYPVITMWEMNTLGISIPDSFSIIASKLLICFKQTLPRRAALETSFNVCRTMLI